MVQWIYNYMFRPCILAIIRLYNNLTSSCAWGTLGGTRSRLTMVGGMALDYYGQVLI